MTLEAESILFLPDSGAMASPCECDCTASRTYRNMESMTPGSVAMKLRPRAPRVILALFTITPPNLHWMEVPDQSSCQSEVSK